MLSGTWSLKLPGRRLFPLLCRKQLAGSAAGDVPYLCKHIGVCAVTARDHSCTGLWERYLLFPRWEVYPIDTNLAWLYVQKDPQLNKVELSSLYVNNWYTHTHTHTIFIRISRSASFSPNEQHPFYIWLNTQSSSVVRVNTAVVSVVLLLSMQHSQHPHPWILGYCEGVSMR